MSHSRSAVSRRDTLACLVRRGVVYGLVGSTGFLVQLTALAGLVLLGLHYLAATVLAVEAAVLNNFWWHERWTWRDRASRTPKRTLSRLARFNLTVGAISIGQNVVLMHLLVEYFGMPYLVASVSAVAACGLINFMISHHVIFRHHPALAGPGEEAL